MVAMCLKDSLVCFFCAFFSLSLSLTCMTNLAPLVSKSLSKEMTVKSWIKLVVERVVCLCLHVMTG